jgi:hypothetical protein
VQSPAPRPSPTGDLILARDAYLVAAFRANDALEKAEQAGQNDVVDEYFYWTRRLELEEALLTDLLERQHLFPTETVDEFQILTDSLRDGIALYKEALKQTTSADLNRILLSKEGWGKRTHDAAMELRRALGLPTGGVLDRFF